MTASAGSATTGGQEPLLIFCAGGSLPFAVADAARKSGRDVFLYALRGWADPEKVAGYSHQWGGLAQLGRFCRYARQNHCRDVVFIGTLTRPSFWSLRPDLKTVARLPKIFAGFKGGDNRLLSIVMRSMEDEGFRVLGAHEIAPDILVPEGQLGNVAASESARADIAVGLDLLRAIGPFDVGQGVIVADNRVLAVEAADGTDLMLDHVAMLRRVGRIATPARTGVLVKAPKPGQDLRVDLPSIGPQTIERAAAAGLAGIAVAAGRTMAADANELARAADCAGLFVIGIRAEPDAP